MKRNPKRSEKRNPGEAKIKYEVIDRSQLGWSVLDIERLVASDHPARIIWEIAGKLHLEAFAEGSKSFEGEAGRPCWPPRLLVSLWVYSYTLKVASARAIERLLAYEPGLRWLAAGAEVGHHTLSDFRVHHKEALEKLFAEFLAILDQAGVVNLRTILHDGTKMKAVAGKASFHRRATLEKRLQTAHRVMRKLDREAAQERQGMDERRQAAQQRAARQKVERAEAALKQLQELEKRTSPCKRAELRVSESEPEAHKMKQTNGGWDPSYNVQISTEAQSRFIVGVGITTEANDLQQLMPALERVESNCGAAPQTIIADSGYATRDNVEQTAERHIDLIAPWKEAASRQAGACARNGIGADFTAAAFQLQAGGKELLCPAGQSLVMIQQHIHHGMEKKVFEAAASDCEQCSWRAQCCGRRAGPRRVEVPVESRAMRQYLARMKRRTTKALYKKRSEIAEFPHLWTKGVQQLRRFSVRGLVKAGMEAMVDGVGLQRNPVDAHSEGECIGSIGRKTSSPAEWALKLLSVTFAVALRLTAFLPVRL